MQLISNIKDHGEILELEFSSLFCGNEKSNVEVVVAVPE